MPELERDGWRLFYEDRGAGPPLLLMHGLMMDHTMLDGVVDDLSHHRSLTPDLRGHGRSEHRTEERSLWDLMEDQVALLDSLGIERAVWGGASVAGPIALRAALRYPERVAGLVLISTQAGPEHPERLPFYEAWAEEVADKGWTEDALNASAATNFGRRAPDALREHWKARWRTQPHEEVPSIMRSLTRRESLLDELADVKAPAVVVYGEDDGVALQREEVDMMVEGLPNVIEFALIPEAGHSPTLEQPKETARVLARFLEQI